MKKAVFLLLLGSILVLAVALDFAGLGQTYQLPESISGLVVGTDGPVGNALLQVQGTPNKTTAAPDGTFTLEGLGGAVPLSITAWAEGYFIGWVTLDPLKPDYDPQQTVTITLKPLFEHDNFHYDWFEFEGVEGTASCGLCHREYKEWLKDAHSKAVVNPRFISIYTGSDVHGNQGKLTTYTGEGKAVIPDPSAGYYGPGYRLDNPQRAGNCATCHTPLASKNDNSINCGWSGCHTDLTAERATQVDYGVIPLHLTGDAADGISCDFCHKVGEVVLDPETDLPYADKPGILSMKLYRPEEGQQVFFGTLLDVTRRVSYSPVQAESEYCAPCHYGVFGGVVGHNSVSGGVVIYNSYGEWLESPYSEPATGKTCQQCHMQVVDENYFVFPERGGIQRDYFDFHDHYMPGASDEHLLQNSVTMQSQAGHQGDQLTVEVKITNDQTGHHIPTDVPIRQMLLVVNAFAADGRQLELVSGPTLPGWAGDYAANPGKAFAKVLRDEWTGEAPTAAYWRPVTILEDTRLPALATDVTQYSFSLPAENVARVEVRLFFRRAFYDLAKQKGWDDPDILMEEATLNVEKSR
jgi:hypothetical protein